MDQNIKVAIRCRPMSQKELARGCVNVITIANENSIRLVKPDDPAASKEFTFDYCYFTDSRQDQVYCDLGQPLLSQAVEGFNGTIFAYGQTGSGKTFSMMGDALNPGIIPRLNDNLWTTTTELQQSQLSQGHNPSQFLISVSFLEIYNEVIRDLLNPNDTPLKIRENSALGIYVEGLCELIVRDRADIMRLIEQGNAVRRVAATNMNEHSSRSHSCFTIRVEKKVLTELEGGVTRESITKGKLNLVDLAGSERAAKTGATGSLLKEGANINLSLMALGNVINALSKGSKEFIPYRESKLTRLLQESLGGNSLTVMLAAISPADYNFDETISTLKYAHRAKSIANAVSRNEDSSDRTIRDLKSQIDQLKSQIASRGGGSDQDQQGNFELQRKLQEMEASQRSAWEEREALSKALELERQRNLDNVISSMMSKVKEQKVNHMKNIKRLSNEKTNFSAKLKECKEKGAMLKKSLDENMKKYQRLQVGYEVLVASGDDADAERIESVASEMDAILGVIESSREEWIGNKELQKKISARLEKIDNNITEERAELVATVDVLEQNDKLRAEIQAEERAKAREAIVAELAAEKEKLDADRAQMLGTLEEKMEREMTFLKRQVSDMHSKLSREVMTGAELRVQMIQSRDYANSLELRLADAEVACETAQQEMERLRLVEQELEQLTLDRKTAINESRIVKDAAEAEIATLKTQVEKSQEDMVEMKKRHTHQMEMERYNTFKSFMNNFSQEKEAYEHQIREAMTERAVFEARMHDAQALFADAVKDILYMSQENQSLRTSLHDAAYWETQPMKWGSSDIAPVRSNTLPVLPQALSTRLVQNSATSQGQNINGHLPSNGISRPSGAFELPNVFDQTSNLVTPQKHQNFVSNKHISSTDEMSILRGTNGLPDDDHSTSGILPKQLSSPRVFK